jgi:hypothetical protein
MIDLDASKPKQPEPPWDLTIRFKGKVYPVREPDASDLKAFLRCTECDPSEAAMEFLKLFCRLTGIAQEDARLRPDQLLSFFRGLMAYRRQRSELSKSGSLLN